MNFILEKILKKITNKAPSKLVTKKPDEDFIPYVCHYDPNTILTKNGELLQVIRIRGFSNNSVAAELISLRDTVRDSIIENVKENKFALWFSTIRRKKNISPKGEFDDLFSKNVNEEWINKNSWNDQYVNELYITIITEGLNTSVTNFKSFTRSFSYSATKSLHKEFLEEAHKKLKSVVAKILADTEEYGGKLLGIKDWEGISYSEPMRFFGKIVNLYEERYPVSANDISNDLASHKVAFGTREIEVAGYNNKNFAALLSVKEYFEVSTASLDRILQLPFEFIITQSFDFAFTRKELEPYEYQNYILKVSGDEDFRQISGAASFIESKRNSVTDYGKLQTTVMTISPTIEKLEKDLKLVFEQFSALGFVVIREDIFSEHCFWSQLPGNFRYLCRQKIINTYRIAGFAALHNFPAGAIDGNKWGPAVTVLKTVLNTPYFFNFHDADTGHSLIVGPKNSGKTVLLNFLLTQSRRFKTKLFYFDFDNKAKAFIKVLSGQYYDISAESDSEEFLHLNPLSLDKNLSNKTFLADFFTSLIAFSKDPIPENEIAVLSQMVEMLMDSNIDSFSKAIEVFNNPQTPTIYQKLCVWNGKKLGHIFGSANEINWNNQINAFDLTLIAQQKPVLIPVVNYLLHRIENALDGLPAIIVLRNAWHLLDNIVIGPTISEFLQRMKEKNCAVIFVADDENQIAESEISSKIKQNLATEIFMPNPHVPQYYKTIFGLNDEEMEIVSVMQEEQRHFLFKNGDDSVISSLNFEDNIELQKIFSADEITLAVLDEVVNQAASNGKSLEVAIWYKQLVEVLKEIEKDRIEEERKSVREKAMAERKRIRSS